MTNFPPKDEEEDLCPRSFNNYELEHDPKNVNRIFASLLQIWFKNKSSPELL